jgi:hypothetical protein
MAEVIWTEPALQELDYIAEYIALDNVVALTGADFGCLPSRDNTIC